MYSLLSSARNNRQLIAEAVDAVGAGVPTGRAVVERPAVAEGAAMSTRAAALRDLDDHRAIDASIAASGMACAPVVRSARPAAKTVETNLFMRVTFGFRRRHHRRKHLPNRAGMNVLPNRRRMMDGVHRNVIDRALWSPT
jgi:hypothetical protein